jgi:hypothetical protein
VSRTYKLREAEYKLSASGPAAGRVSDLLSPTLASTRKLEQTFRKNNKVIERAQKKVSRTGKDKSLLHCAVRLGFIVNKHPIMKDGKKYVNPMTMGDRLFLEEIGTYKSVEFFNNEFTDKDNKLIYIDGYK